MDLTDAQIERYSRQIILPAIGGRGQQRLLQRTVSLVGDGSLAATVALYLTAAGIGRLERWATSDHAGAALQRARHDLAALNADTIVEVARLEAHGAAPSFAGPVVCADIDAATLRFINRAALRQRLPLLAGAGGSIAKMALYAGHEPGSPCAACDPAPPVWARSARGGEAARGLLGSVLALEAIKTVLALSGSRTGWALQYDPETLRISESPVAKRPSCRVCTVNA